MAIHRLCTVRNGSPNSKGSRFPPTADALCPEQRNTRKEPESDHDYKYAEYAMQKGPCGTELGRLSSKQNMDSAQPTKLDFLTVPATPFSIGVLASIVVLVTVVIGPKAVIDTVLNVSTLSSGLKGDF